MSRIALAVDGGNSKTDLALVGSDGALLAYVRGPQSSPHHLGVAGSVELIEGLLSEAWRRVALPDPRPRVDVAHLLLAGVDFPDEEDALCEALAARDLAVRLSVGNDTFAVLRAATDKGWGIAIVCGAGINCVGVGLDGRHVRFASLGDITGDWGGGLDVGMAALSAAARSEDGRGPRTSLEEAVPAHFGYGSPLELARAIHGGTVSRRRLNELAPVVFGEAGHDAVAAAIIERLVAEIAAFARAAIVRLELGDEPVDVLLGGGLVQAAAAHLVPAVQEVLRGTGRATVRATASPPIVGAALLGLDDLGAGPDAGARARRELELAASTGRWSDG